MPKKNYNLDITREETAYLAGIIDGEGWIGSGYYGNQKAQQVVYRITISSSSKELIDWLVDKLKVATVYKNNHSPLTKKTCYNLEIRRFNQVKSILKAVLPYSIIKKDLITEILEKMEGGS